MEDLLRSTKAIQGHIISHKNKLSLEISHRTQETLVKALQNTIEPKFAGISRTLQESLPFKQPQRTLRELFQHYALLLFCTFLSAAMGATCVYVLGPKKPAFPYSSEIIYYGSLLKSAWPHLTDKEKERLKSSGKKAGKRVITMH